MSKVACSLSVFFLLASSVGSSQESATPASNPQGPQAPKKICEYVVTAEVGAKPYQLCMTKAEWNAKKLADAQDATRQVCHYEEMPGTRLRSRKICMTANEWAEQRRLDREAVEKIQSSVCVAGGGC